MFWAKKKEDQFKTSREGGIREESSVQKNGGVEKSNEDADMSKTDELAALYATTIKDIQEGQIIKGRIIEVRSKEVVVDIGYKSEGIINLAEFSEPEKLNVGDEIEVLLELKEDEHGCVVCAADRHDYIGQSIHTVDLAGS